MFPNPCSRSEFCINKFFIVRIFCAHRKWDHHSRNIMYSVLMLFSVALDAQRKLIEYYCEIIWMQLIAVIGAVERDGRKCNHRLTRSTPHKMSTKQTTTQSNRVWVICSHSCIIHSFILALFPRKLRSTLNTTQAKRQIKKKLISQGNVKGVLQRTTLTFDFSTVLNFIKFGIAHAHAHNINVLSSLFAFVDFIIYFSLFRSRSFARSLPIFFRQITFSLTISKQSEWFNLRYSINKWKSVCARLCEDPCIR